MQSGTIPWTARCATPLTPGDMSADEYLANGYNGTAAYKVEHPRCRSANTPAVEAHRLLRKPKVATFFQRTTGTT